MDQLLGEAARMAPHWSDPGIPSPSLSAAPAGTPRLPAAHEALGGVRVPAAGARLTEGMSEYGDC